MIVLRRATPGDADAVCTLVDALLMELSGTESRHAARMEATRHVLALTDRCHGLLAEEDGQAVGVMMISENAAIYAGGSFGVITELYVSPGYRSQRVAKMLLAEASSLGRRKGWSALEVGAPRQPQWARSLHFYLDAGFTEIGPRLRLRLTA